MTRYQGMYSDRILSASEEHRGEPRERAMTRVHERDDEVQGAQASEGQDSMT